MCDIKSEIQLCQSMHIHLRNNPAEFPRIQFEITETEAFLKMVAQKQEKQD